MNKTQYAVWVENSHKASEKQVFNRFVFILSSDTEAEEVCSYLNRMRIEENGYTHHYYFEPAELTEPKIYVPEYYHRVRP
ncbi:MAG: hypothetical protein HPY53_01075 [Brevinematales bacterium]|nr:hypothetical protein [Brevinematales bacterium]